MEKIYENLVRRELPKSQLEITAEIPTSVQDSHKKTALKNLGADANVPGFRKGHVPEKIILERIGEMGLLKECAFIAIEKAWPKILEEEKVAILGEPQVAITKIAIGAPVEFKMVMTLMPEIKLPDYKAIAKKEVAPEIKIEVTEKNIDEVILEIRKQRAHEELHKSGGAHDHQNFNEKVEEKDLPEIDEAFLKSIGDFKNISELRDKIKENLAKEKEWKEKDKRRASLVESLVKESEVEIPEILVEAELDKMFAQFRADVERVGMKFEDYMKSVKKSEIDLKKEWRESAEKRAKLQLVISKIADVEKIEPEADQVKKEVEHLLKHHQGADPLRAHAYVRMILANEKVMQFLEGQK